jgi:hypothetical protein
MPTELVFGPFGDQDRLDNYAADALCALAPKLADPTFAKWAEQCQMEPPDLIASLAWGLAEAALNQRIVLEASDEQEA